MVAFDQNTKNLSIPSSLGNFPSVTSAEGITEEEAQALIDSAITDYDSTVQGYIADVETDVEDNSDKIETLSGTTSGIAADLAALSAYTGTIQSGEPNDDAIIEYTGSGADLEQLFADIKAAVAAGKTVFLKGQNTDRNTVVLPLVYHSEETYTFTGTGVQDSDRNSIKTFFVGVYKYGTEAAGINGVSGGRITVQTMIDRYQLPKASSSTLGGVKVGSGLTIDNGVLSVSGGTGGDSKYVVVEALSAVTNPVEGMIAYVPGYSVDNTYQFVKYQVKPDVEEVEGTRGWLRREDTNPISEIYQSGSGFFWGPWEQGNNDFEFRKSSWDDPYDGRSKIYTALWRSYNDAEDAHNSWIEISTALTQEILLFDVDISNTTTSLTSETVTTYYSEAFYQYENGAWKEMYIPELFDFDKATAAQRVALFNAIKSNPMYGDWNVKMAFFATFENGQRVETRAKLQFCDIYGNDWLFFSATFGKIDNGEGVVSAIIRLYSDGHYDKEVWALEKSSVGNSEISRDGRLQYDMALSAFTVNGSPDYNVTGNTCTWEGPYDWGEIDQVLSGDGGKLPSFRFNMYPGNDDYNPVLSMAYPVLSISSFSPAVTCTDRDGNQADFDKEVEYNYGRYSIKLWASPDSNYRYANIRLIEN